MRKDLAAADELDDLYPGARPELRVPPAWAADDAAVELDRHAVLGQVQLPDQVGDGGAGGDLTGLAVEANFELRGGG